MVAIIPRSGSVARRLARPMISSAEHPSSNAADIVAASSGGRTGTRYSLRNSATVDSQLDTFTMPAFRNTLATPSRNRSWWIESGTADNRSSQPATPRRGAARVVAYIVVVLIGNLLWRAQWWVPRGAPLPAGPERLGQIEVGVCCHGSVHGRPATNPRQARIETEFAWSSRLMLAARSGHGLACAPPNGELVSWTRRRASEVRLAER